MSWCRRLPDLDWVFFKYEKAFSIVLLAVCEAQYNFTLVNIGDSSLNSDGWVLTSCNIGYATECNCLNIPKSKKTGSFEQFFPYVFVGDEAFRISEYMIKPCPPRGSDFDGDNFNSRLWRAGYVIENIFGIVAARLRMLRRSFVGYPVKCHCCSHIETSQFIYAANWLTGFYMRATLAFNGLNRLGGL